MRVSTILLLTVLFNGLLLGNEEERENLLKCIETAIPEGWSRIQDTDEAKTDMFIAGLNACIDKGLTDAFKYLCANGATTEKLFDHLVSKGAKCCNLHDNTFKQYGMEKYLDNPLLLIEKKYQNLSAPKGDNIKIPLVVHHIHLANETGKVKLEPEQLDIAQILPGIFYESGYEWKHIFWSDNLDENPELMRYLTAAGYELRRIGDYDWLTGVSIENENPDLKPKGTEKWLGLHIINHEGGFVMEQFYELKRSLEREAYTYDFFAGTFYSYHINDCLYGARSGHPIIKKTLELLALDPVQSHWNIADILDHAYYIEANEHGTTDVIYPLADDGTEGSTTEQDIATFGTKNSLYDIYKTYDERAAEWYTVQNKDTYTRENLRSYELFKRKKEYCPDVFWYEDLTETISLNDMVGGKELYLGRLF